MRRKRHLSTVDNSLKWLGKGNKQVETYSGEVFEKSINLEQWDNKVSSDRLTDQDYFGSEQWGNSPKQGLFDRSQKLKPFTQTR